MNICYELSQDSGSQIHSIDIEGIYTISNSETLYDISIVTRESTNSNELIFVRNAQNEVLESLEKYQTRNNRLISSSDFENLMAEDRFRKYNPRKFHYDSYDHDRLKKIFKAK